MDYANILLLTPQNDEESRMIVKLATAAGIPLLVSKQPHGARLEKEEKLVERLREANPRATTVFIVEMPGVDAEKRLQDEGFDVQIIDHHRYDALDRMQETSSLEQFLVAFDIDDAKMSSLGFDPALVRGVGMIDRGFLWALRSEVTNPAEQKRIRDYYRSLTLELGKDRAAIEEAAQKAWDAREVIDGVIVVRSQEKSIGIRDAISFLVADTFSAPQQVVVLEGERRMFVQESDAVAKLFATYGGFTFGRDRCWGVQAAPDKPLPPLADVLAILATCSTPSQHPST